MSLKNEYVVVCDHSKSLLSASAFSSRIEAVEANKFYPEQIIGTARLISVDVDKGVATVERYATVDRCYCVDVLPAYRLCSKMERAAAAEAEAEAKMWAGCPRNYLSYC
tara:strand:+ start:1089 stop:1415 length:327 start_codon:yes stop_codon:yes gene_type:complete